MFPRTAVNANAQAQLLAGSMSDFEALYCIEQGERHPCHFPAVEFTVPYR